MTTSKGEGGENSIMSEQTYVIFSFWCWYSISAFFTITGAMSTATMLLTLGLTLTKYLDTCKVTVCLFQHKPNRWSILSLFGSILAYEQLT